MNESLQDVRLPLAKGDEATSQRHSQQGHLRGRQAKEHRFTHDKSDRERCGNSQADRGQYRTEQDIDRALHLIPRGGADRCQTLRCKDQGGHNKPPELEGKTSSLKAKIQQVGHLLGEEDDRKHV